MNGQNKSSPTIRVLCQGSCVIRELVIRNSDSLLVHHSLPTRNNRILTSDEESKIRIKGHQFPNVITLSIDDDILFVEVLIHQIFLLVKRTNVNTSCR